jgi:hypothetical protein
VYPPKTTLRDHPASTIAGGPSWPPVWVHSKTKPIKKLYGEVGVFTGTILHDDIPTALFIRMVIDETAYMGYLGVNDAVFCYQLNKFLQHHIGRTIAEIADLDISFTL